MSGDRPGSQIWASLFGALALLATASTAPWWFKALTAKNSSTSTSVSAGDPTNQPAPPTTVPVTTARAFPTTCGCTSRATIELDFDHTEYADCNVRLAVQVGDVTDNPDSDTFRMAGVRTGAQAYSVTGRIDCTGGSCVAHGSGSVLIDQGATFSVVTDPGDCSVSLVNL
jgi:hypothetical protein